MIGHWLAIECPCWYLSWTYGAPDCDMCDNRRTLPIPPCELEQ